MQSIPGTITNYTQGVDQLDTLDKSAEEIAAIRADAASRLSLAVRIRSIANRLESGSLDAEGAQAAVEALVP